MPSHKLTPEQMDRARDLFWNKKLTLGQIAKELGCGLYDLTGGDSLLGEVVGQLQRGERTCTHSTKKNQSNKS